MTHAQQIQEEKVKESVCNTPKYPNLYWSKEPTKKVEISAHSVFHGHHL